MDRQNQKQSFNVEVAIQFYEVEQEIREFLPRSV